MQRSEFLQKIYGVYLASWSTWSAGIKNEGYFKGIQEQGLQDTPEIRSAVEAAYEGQYGDRCNSGDVLKLMVALETAWETYPKACG